MKVNHLELKDFRNYEDLEIAFSERINVIYGNNGQGKTNLVEAIAYLSNLKSFRMHKDSALIRKDAPFFLIEAKVSAQGRETHLGCRYSNKEKIKLINHHPVERNSDFIGMINVISFNTGDVWMFKDVSIRRYFIDSELMKISPSYHHSLSKYQKVLKERNELLKQEKIDELYLKVLTRTLAEESLVIINKRLDFIDKLNDELESEYQSLTGKKYRLSLHYHSDFELPVSADEIYRKYERNLEKDRQRQVTQIGVHLDDVQVNLNDLDIQIYGSQGQQRLAAIALKLALVKVVTRQSGERPIVIFDDVMSDLDEERRKKLLSALNDSNQVFITTANVSDIRNFIGIGETAYYLIENGKVVSIERK